MIDLIFLYFILKKIGVLAVKKGLPPLKWKIATVVLWLTYEIFGLVFGIALFGTGDMYSLMAFGLICAFGGYLTARYILENKPDNKII